MDVIFVWNQGSSTISGKALTAHGVILSLIILPSIIGNGALILTVIIEKRFRTPTNHLVVSQCLIDLLITLTVPLLSLIAVFRGGMFLGPQCCILQVVLSRVFIFATVLHFALLSIDRYIVIVQSNRKDRFTQKEVAIACSSLWLLSAIFSLPWDILFYPEDTWFEITSTFCYVRYIQNDDRKWFTLTIIRAVLLLFIPILIMTFCYYHILGVLRMNRRKVCPSTVSNWRKIAVAVYAKSAYTSLAVLCSFFICALPFLIAHSFTLLGKVGSYEIMASFKVILFSSTAIKPAIYITRSVSWSRKLRRIFKKKKRSEQRIVDSPAPRRSSKYVVGNRHKTGKSSKNVKLGKCQNTRRFNSHDFLELFTVSGTKQAWESSLGETRT